MGEPSFEEVQKQLTEAFANGSTHPETDEEIGGAFLDLILQSERSRRCVEMPSPELDEVDRQTLERLYLQTELGAEHSLAEGVFKRLAKDPTNAMRYFRLAVEKQSAVQTQRAQKNRPGSYDSITKLINDCVDLEPNISTRAVIAELTAMDGIVIADDEIRNTHDATTMQISNLASRVSDARRRAKKRIGLTR